VVSNLLAQAERTRGPRNPQAAPRLAQQTVAEAFACDSSTIQIRCLIGLAEMVDQHDGLFPLIDLKEDDGLPVG
jgi:hypothetical protein